MTIVIKNIPVLKEDIEIKFDSYDLFCYLIKMRSYQNKG